MKTRGILMNTLCSLMLSMGFVGCIESEEEPEPTIDPIEKPNYILHEGHWGANNASIAMFNHPANGIVQTDAYLNSNGKQMGDVANAIIEEDNNIYVLLNGSKYVARLDLMAKEQARYTFTNGESEPRCMDVEDDYAYVTQYGGQISKLNIDDMTLAGTFKGGDNLEGIIEKDGKLYVANSYKVDGSGNYIYNNVLLVINAKDMTQTGTIQVVENPDKIFEIDGRIYLISRGNYEDIPWAFQLINPKNNTSETILNDVSKITEGINGMIYGVRSTYDENWNSINSFFVYNPKTNQVSETSFLKDAPSALYSTAISLLEMDEETGFIYVGTTDYQNTGTIYAFDKDGKLFQTFDSSGVNPSAMIFID